MSATLERELATDILEILRERNGEATFDDLLTALRLRHQDADEVDIKAALWPLISRGALELTAQRTLRLVQANFQWRESL